jgi:hypothetical protein
MRWSLPALLVAVFGLAPGGPAAADPPADDPTRGDPAAPPSGQVLADGILTDFDYRFRLELPTDRFRLLDERAMAGVDPDAVAGATSVSGSRCEILWERAPGVALADFADLVFDAAPGVKERAQREETEWQGLPAVRLQLEVAGPAGPQVREQIVALRGAWGVQLFCDAGARATPGGDAEAFFADVGLLDGPLVGRSSARVDRDRDGVGWRTRGGLYENATFGLVVRPAAGWWVSVGDDLAEMNESAEVGLVWGESDAYALVLIEPVPAEAMAATAASALANVRSAIAGPIDEPPATWVVSGQERTFTRTRASQGAPFVFNHAVFAHKGRLVQVLAWYLAPLRQRAEQALPQAVAGIELLDGPAREALRAAIGPGAHDRQVGPGFAIRNGTWTHFDEGLQWTQPVGSWRIYGGAEAQARMESSSLLVAEAPGLGLTVTAWLEDVAPRARLKRVHAELVVRFVARGPRPREAWAAGRPALTSEFDTIEDGAAIRYRVSTLLRGERALQVVLWGLPGNMAAAAGVVDEVLANLTVGEPHQPTAIADDGGWRDLRAGFAFEAPGPGWTCRDATRPEVRPIGAQVYCAGGREAVVAMGLDSAGTEADEEWFASFAEQLMPGALKESMAGLSRAPGELAGRPSVRLQSTGPGMAISFDFLVVQGTLFLVMTMLEDGTGDAAAIRRGFRLLP